MGTPIDPVAFALGAGCGAAALAGVWALLRWRRREPSRATFLDDSPQDAPAVTPAAPTPAVPTDSTPVALVRPTAARVTLEQFRLSERIVVRMAQEGRLVPSGLVPRARTQQGLAEEFDTTQGAVSKVLARLVSAGAMVEERRFVQGDGRRFKVYDLTRLGERLARDIADRHQVSLLPDLQAASDARAIDASDSVWIRPRP